MFERYNAYVFSKLVLVCQQMHVPDVLAWDCLNTYIYLLFISKFINKPKEQFITYVRQYNFG